MQVSSSCFPQPVLGILSILLGVSVRNALISISATPPWVPVKWGCDHNHEKQRDGLSEFPWTPETSELQFVGRGDCQQMCQDESGQEQRQERHRVGSKEPADSRQSRMAGPGRPGLPTQGLLGVRKGLSGPRGGPTASAPFTATRAFHERQLQSPGIPTASREGAGAWEPGAWRGAQLCDT